MEAGVDQNVVDQKYGEIERKNLLITNENLISNCIAQDIFYIVTNSALSTSRFHDLSTAYNVAMNRERDTPDSEFQKQLIRKLKAPNLQNSKLTKVRTNQHLEYKSLDSQNFQLKQTVTDLKNQLEDFKPENVKIKLHYQELFNSINVTHAQTIEKAKSLQNEIENLRAQLKGKMPCVTSDVKTPKVSTFEKYAINVEPIPPRLNKNPEVHLHYTKCLKENVETLREIVEDAKVERPLDTSLASACRYTKHSQELLEYVIGTCPKDFGPSDKQNASTNSLRKKRVNFVEPCETSTHNTPSQVKQTWKPTGKIFTTIGYHWKPTGRIFPLGDQCPLTRITKPKALLVKQWKPTGRLIPLDGQCPLVRPSAPTNSPNPVASNLVVQIDLLILKLPSESTHASSET
ncbi:hypothetical protein Tco_0053002 [Tanacetum coccineum]